MYRVADVLFFFCYFLSYFSILVFVLAVFIDPCSVMSTFIRHKGTQCYHHCGRYPQFCPRDTDYAMHFSDVLDCWDILV